MKIYSFVKIKSLVVCLLFAHSLIGQELYAPNSSGTPTTVGINIDGTTVDVEVEVFDNVSVLEGDMIISNGNTGRGAAAVSQVNRRWDRGVIPYKIASGHTRESLIRSAITELENATNLTFVEQTTETDYVLIRQPSSGCSAHVGKIGGEQQVNISTGCSKGNIMHELLHAAGFMHEQTRRDRGEHVLIKWDNIIAGKEGNFQKYDYGTGVAMGTYDYNSIMHYGKNYFAIDRSKPTIVTKDRSKQNVIGQRTSLSRQDIRQVNRIYRADGRTTDYSSSGRGGTTGTASDSTSWQIQNPQSFDVQFDVQLVPQLTGMSCWAAGAAMIVGWRDEISINPEEIARGIGYWSAYHNNGLPPDDTTMFATWGLESKAPTSYTVQGLVDLIAQKGPLWVATAEPGPHIRVISGIAGDGTPDGTVLTIKDPWQRGMRRFRMPNNGSTYTETYTEFMRKQAQLARTEFNIAAPIYIAHN